MELLDWGWSEDLEKAVAEVSLSGAEPARVVRGARRVVGVRAADGALDARVGPTLRKSEARRPVVGDWVLLGPGRIDDAREIVAILPRFSAFVRKGAGLRSREQVVATNVDVVFVVTDATTDLNLRRLERYLTLGWASGATPVIVVNKIDLVAEPDDVLARVRPVAAGAEVLGISVLDDRGLDELSRHLLPRRTVALLGSSGVGKSTLVNHLAGREVMSTGVIRESDGRGRHTTTRRQLFMLPSGAMVVDTPGMRELGLWDADDGLSEAFSDVERLAEACRFRDCAHESEPGCAVREAVERGDLDEARARSFVALRRELDEQDARRAEAERRASKGRDRAFARMVRRSTRSNPKR